MPDALGDIDLLIVNDDLVLDEIGVPLLVTGRACIVQDILNMIRDKGYLVLMVAERDPHRRAVLLGKIENEIEADTRIRPGTARVTEVTFERFLITAVSLKYGAIDVDFLSNKGVA